MDTAVVLFTRDLRLSDNPALAAAEREARHVVRLFVRDPRFGAPERRHAFLGRLLAELPVTVVEGDYLEEVARFDPDAVFMSEDASPYARRRERRLAERFDLRLYAGTTVVALDELKPYRVFTPYYRQWLTAPRRPYEPRAEDSEAQRVLAAWTRDHRQTGSQLSPYLHFGALSPLECAERCSEKLEFVRQLAWRDFYLQLLRAEPDRFALGASATARDDERAAAWREGRTGVAIVDAGMRQLREEGWMPNRIRMICAQHLVHTLGVDWRVGAAHFEEHLVDGDVAANRGNWLWVVQNTRRLFNPELQAQRLAAYVERWRIPVSE
ncbi:MAG TPA: FAD-binding domain-containing protein [Gaiellaceae bacterium]